jgi:UDP-GlcNAc:undecaprenyl-phosphate/decaprenyl-phosphate GlcNAc-1-phosphate transferase
VTSPGLVIAAGVSAFILVSVLTETMRRVAIRHRFVDLPRADRVHVIATPYLGGIAISGGTIVAVAGVAHPGASPALAIVVAGTAMSVVGLIDDLRRLSQTVRLVAECLAATALVVVGVHVNIFAGVPIAGGWVDGIITVVWIVVITNSFNLLDNMDGAAAAIAFSSPPILAVLALASGRQDVATLMVALSAGCAGFLVHNWTPARIFMGDAGSLFLGFVTSSATVLICSAGGFSDTSIATVAGAMLLMTFVPVVDTCTVMLSRKLAGHRWNQGGTDHIAHRLQAIGLSTSHTAILLSATAAVTTLLGILVVGGIVPAGGLLAATVAVGVAIVALAQKVEAGRRHAEQSSTSIMASPSSPGVELRIEPSSSGLVPGQRLAVDSDTAQGKRSSAQASVPVRAFVVSETNGTWVPRSKSPARPRLPRAGTQR